ncbi:hypothetical protein ABB02_00790 [Clostridiaceae bacterium JG1575]|nr:hypothetical protein ABB02_00790 [Clostridiaceae bacterium JG1575]
MRSIKQKLAATLCCMLLLSGCGPLKIANTKGAGEPAPGTSSATSTPKETRPSDPVRTQGASSKETVPATKPEKTPKTQVTPPVKTKPLTGPKATGQTKPSPKESGDYGALSNEGDGWSYGYPTEWVREYDGYWQLTPGKLYLTMDLGYEMGFTEEILNTLREKNVKVTFFLTTEYLEERPDLVLRMLREGHKIGSHSTKHIPMTKLVGTDGAKLIENTRTWERAYKELTGQTSQLYRAPEGVFSKRGLAVLKDLGYRNIFWGAAYADWLEQQPTVEEAKKKLYPFVDSGDIVLLHPFQTNAKLLPEFIDHFRAKGYAFELIP